MKFRSRIAKKEVFDFKENYCDENEIITRILENDLKPFMIDPILDVGAGIGDISFKALVDKRVIMIDVNNISRHDYPCRPNHKRKKCDFFDYDGKGVIETILISHTLQFLDDDINRLNNKIKELSPTNIVLVLNSNTDIMGELIEWSAQNFEKPNPELRIDLFPQGYKLVKTLPFKATLRCPDFRTLAKQVSYLMLVNLEDKEEALINFLKRMLPRPEFSFDQSIDLYHKL